MKAHNAALALVRAKWQDGPDRILSVLSPKRGFYTLPGGKIEPGEGPLEAAVRELREETGLIASQVEQAYYDITKERTTPALSIEVFKITSYYGFLREEKPGHSLRWFTPKKFMEQIGPYGVFYRPFFLACGVE